MKSYIAYTDPLCTPRIFRKWAAIATVSGALERKVWVRTRRANLYPNLYILLVGGAGVGKTLSISDVARFWNELDDHHVAPVSVTTAALMDVMNESKRKIIRPTEVPPYIEYNSLMAAIGEFSEFAPMYDPSFMSKLQALYDCELTSERRRGSKTGEIKIENPQFGFIAGTTPSFLNSFMPDVAWDQGFISRTVMIYSGETQAVQFFSDEQSNEGLFQDLLNDLKVIDGLYGLMGWTQEAADAIQSWEDQGREPMPEHRRLLYYNTRRGAHLIKLCMVASVMRSNDLAIEIEDFHTALDWLSEAEMHMTDIFKAMTTGGDSVVMEDAYHFIYSLYAKKNDPVPEHKIYSFIKDRAPIHAVPRIVEIMVKSKMIEVVAYNGSGLTTYRPVPKHLHKD